MMRKIYGEKNFLWLHLILRNFSLDLDCYETSLDFHCMTTIRANNVPPFWDKQSINVVAILFRPFFFHLRPLHHQCNEFFLGGGRDFFWFFVCLSLCLINGDVSFSSPSSLSWGWISDKLNGFNEWWEEEEENILCIERNFFQRGKSCLFWDRNQKMKSSKTFATSVFH